MTMSGFQFGEADTFATNWEAFLKEMEAFDAEMAAILRANKAKLAAICAEGNRDAQARGNFNAAVLEALDALLLSKTKKGGTS
jgi:hypothetical protein